MVAWRPFADSKSMSFTDGRKGEISLGGGQP
jgi:hypothetical protein